MNLLQTLVQDAEAFAGDVLPEPKDIPKVFAALVQRVEAALPGLAHYDIAEIRAAAEQAGSLEPENVETTISHQSPAGQVAQVAPSNSAGTAQGGAPSETLAQRLRKQADELEAAELGLQDQAAAATAAGAGGGPVVTESGQAQPTQVST